MSSGMFICRRTGTKDNEGVGIAMPIQLIPVPDQKNPGGFRIETLIPVLFQDHPHPVVCRPHEVEWVDVPGITVPAKMSVEDDEDEENEEEASEEEAGRATSTEAPEPAPEEKAVD